MTLSKDTIENLRSVKIEKTSHQENPFGSLVQKGDECMVLLLVVVSSFVDTGLHTSKRGCVVRRVWSTHRRLS